MAQTVKNLPAVQETLGQEDHLEREWLPTPVFLPVFLPKEFYYFL